jgi:hypothetical protein
MTIHTDGKKAVEIRYNGTNVIRGGISANW